MSEVPHISINKLGEYLGATPARRKKIISDQKNPKDFIVSRYSEAREAIGKFIESGLEDEEGALAKAQELLNTTPRSDFNEQDLALSAEAIEEFVAASDEIDLDMVSAERSDRFDSTSMNISGVSVSIRPDAILKDKKGKVVGAVKLHFSKTNPLDKKGAEYVATALRVCLEEASENPAEIDRKKCYVVDIPTRQVVCAPRAIKRRMDDISCACEEIRDRWATV